MTEDELIEDVRYWKRRAEAAEAELSQAKDSQVVAWRWKVSPEQLNWQYSDAPPAKFPVYNLELLYRGAP